MDFDSNLGAYPHPQGKLYKQWWTLSNIINNETL